MNFKSIIGFAFGPIATSALGFLSVPVIAWIFKPEDVGRLNLFQVTLSLAMMVALLGLDQAYVRDYHTSSNKRQLLGGCLVPGLSVIAATLLTTVFFAEEIAYFLYGIRDYKLYLLTVTALIFSYISRFLSLILRMQERGFSFSISQILPKLLQLLLVSFLALASFQKNFVHLLSITVLSLVLVCFLYTWNTKNHWKEISYADLKEFNYSKVLNFGLPLIVTGFSYLGINAINTYLLRFYSSLSELAIYSVAMSFAGIAAVIQSIFTVIWTPLAFKWEANSVEVKRINDVAQAVLAVICTLAALVGSLTWVLDFILPPSYSHVQNVVLCFMVQPLLYTLSVVTSIGIGFSRKSSYSIISTVPALFLNSCISFLLIEDFGVTGAAIGSSASYFFLFIANSEASAKAWKRIPMLRTYCILAILVSFCIFNALFGLLLNFNIIWALVLFLTVFYFRGQWIIIYKAYIKAIRVNN